MAAGIRVGIIEDLPNTRESLAKLCRQGGMDVVGQAAFVDTALAGWTEEPDVLLLDIGLPGISGLEGLPRLMERYRGARVLMLTVHGDDAKLFAAIQLGASGYLLKDTPPERLVAAIREVYQGGSALSPALARRVMDELRRTQATAVPAQGPLTAKESRVLRLIADGHSYKSCAAELGVSLDTVRSHVRSIYDKLRVHTKAEAVLKATRSGLF